MQWYLELLARFPVLVLLIISAAGVVSGDLFAKTWSTNQKPIFFALAILGYAVSALFYVPTLLRDSLIITSIIWSLLSIIGFLIIGLVIFHETLTPTQTVGVVIGVIALLVLAASE